MIRIPSSQESEHKIVSLDLSYGYMYYWMHVCKYMNIHQVKIVRVSTPEKGTQLIGAGSSF